MQGPWLLMGEPGGREPEGLFLALCQGLLSDFTLAALDLRAWSFTHQRRPNTRPKYLRKLL